MMRHLILHLLRWINQPVLACDGDDLLAGHLGKVATGHAQGTLNGVEQAVFLVGQPDEVVCTVIECDAVEVVTLITFLVALLGGGHSSRLSGGRSGLRTYPRKCYGMREEDVPEVAHLVVTLFAMTVEPVDGSGVHDRHLFAIDPLMRTCLFVENADVRVGLTLRRSVQRPVTGSFNRQDKMHLCAIG